MITLALVANGTIAQDDFHVPDWVVISAATAIALGTYVGGWRIIKTMGSRIHKMDSAQGFAAQGAGAAVILAASNVGFPLSTTHDLGRRDRIGRGQAAVGRALAWPGTSSWPGCSRSRPRRGIGALTYGVTRLFGTGAAGPVIVSSDRGWRGRSLRAAGAGGAEPPRRVPGAAEASSG